MARARPPRMRRPASAIARPASSRLPSASKRGHSSSRPPASLSLLFARSHASASASENCGLTSVPPIRSGKMSWRRRQLLTAARPTPAIRAISARVTGTAWADGIEITAVGVRAGGAMTTWSARLPECLGQASPITWQANTDIDFVHRVTGVRSPRVKGNGECDRLRAVRGKRPRTPHRPGRVRSRHVVRGTVEDRKWRRSARE